MTFLLARPETSGPRVRLYCEMLPSLLVGVPSKNHNGRRRIPVAPPSVGRIADVMRDLNAGSRYLSNRSVGSMICMSQSTNRYPSFILRSFHLVSVPSGAICRTLLHRGRSNCSVIGSGFARATPRAGMVSPRLPLGRHPKRLGKAEKKVAGTI